MTETAAAATPTTSTLREFVASAGTAMPVIHAARAAIELDIAEYLADGPLSVEELTIRANAHAPSLFRLLRALESVGIFVQVAPRVFANTPDSELLRKGVPGSLWVRLRAPLSCGLFEAYAGLPESIRTGRTAFELIHGCALWEFLQRDPTRETLFGQFMGARHAVVTPAVTAAYSWNRFPLIADIGGGIGTQLVDILESHPSCHGLLFDQPDVIDRAIPHDRMASIGGSFFEGVPTNADAYILRTVIHDWPDSQAITILKNVHAATKPDSRVFLIEEIIPETSGFASSKWADLNMLMFTGGQERTTTEYRRLLEDAGFELEQVIPTSAELNLIVSRPH